MAPLSYRTSAPRPPDGAPEPEDEAARLGALRSVHEPVPGHVPYGVVILTVLAAVLPSLATGGVSRASLIVALPVVLVLGVSLLWPALRRRGLRVELHSGGVVVHRRGARDVAIFDDIDEVWFDTRHVTSYLVRYALLRGIRIVDHGGAEHYVPTTVRDGVAVTSWILRHGSEPLLPDARSALAAGERLEFGKVRLDRDRIAIGRATARWSELRLVRMQSGRIAFFRRWPVFPWRTVELDEVPHPTVFGRLVAEHAPRVEDDSPFRSPPR